MAYEFVPEVLTRNPGTPEAEEAIRRLLVDLASRKEYRSLGAPLRPPADAGPVAGFLMGGAGPLTLPGLRLSGGQQFVSNLMSPDTEFERLLINWQTGTGKSIGAAAIGHGFAAQYRAKAALGGRGPTVFVISFLARETIQEEMLRHPEFGFSTAREVEELRALRAAALAGGSASAAARQLSNTLGVLRRRTTDRDRGGYYRFYGYKEFANQLFEVTPLGAARGFDVLTLYAVSSAAEAAGPEPEEGPGPEGGPGPSEFERRLRAAVSRGEVRVNEALLDDLRGGLLVADEIPNTYNVAEKNNYGVAIQYSLDALGAEAPRVVVMTATPMTGSAGEVVDLLNFLVPRRHLPGGRALRRADFFARVAAREGEGGPQVSQLREGALARIAHLAAGRVSYLLDADQSAYPRRRFAGEADPEVPYLRLTLCPMSPYHERTLRQEQAAAGKGEAAGLAADAYALYDMVWPNPAAAPDAPEADPGSTGLYRSGEVLPRLAQAPDEWKAAAGVSVAPGPAPGVRVATGPFLRLERVGVFSAKLEALARKTIARIRAGPGKIMVYHPRVRGPGVLQIAEMYRMVGLADEAAAPTDSTLCGVCGRPRGGHPAGGHEYTPARYVLAHSAIDRAVMLRSIARYNSPANLEGHQYRVIVASRVLREGHNLVAVREEWIAGCPADYPELIQILGRAVRRGSHLGLPEDQRDVTHEVLVSAYRDGRPSPELQRYRDKGKEFLVIQEVERALHRYATDGFLNEERIRAALHAGPGGIRPSLDSLPYAPLLGQEEARALPVRAATFEAYGHGSREVALLAAVCRRLFRERPVWAPEDLWAAVRAGAVRGTGRDPASFEEGNFAAALLGLRRPAGGDPPTAVVQAGRFFVLARVGPGGRPELDVEAHLRWAPAPAGGASVRVADFLREARAGQNFEVRLRAFDEAYFGPGRAAPLEASLVERGAGFHFALLRRLIEAQTESARVTADDGAVLDLYRRFRVLVTVADASAPAAARAYRGGPAGPPEAGVGYLAPNAVNLYDPASRAWYSAPHADFGVGRRHAENDIVVGFVATAGHASVGHDRAAADPGAEAEAAPGAAPALALFKIRPPIQALRGSAGADAGRRPDIRGLARGAVCATRPREELEATLGRLREALAGAGLPPPAGERRGGALALLEGLPARLDYAARYDRAALKRYPSAAELCDAIRLHLLALEEAARAPADGMTAGLRWLYLFHDRPPSVAAAVAVAR